MSQEKKSKEEIIPNISCTFCKKSFPNTDNTKDTVERHFCVVITKTEWSKCPRCWRYDPTVGQDTGYKHSPAWFELCYRCATVMELMFTSGELKDRDLELYQYRVKNGTQDKR